MLESSQFLGDKMTLSIPIPVVPIKLTIGKEKKEDAPIVKEPIATPATQSSLDGRDIAIVCMTAMAIVAILAILFMAMRHQGAIGRI